MGRKNGLLKLPIEVLMHVLEQLDPIDLCYLAQVCVTLNEVTSSDRLWQRFCAPGWHIDKGESRKLVYMDRIRFCVRNYVCRMLEVTGQNAPPTAGKQADAEKKTKTKTKKKKKEKKREKEKSNSLVELADIELVKVVMLKIIILGDVGEESEDMIRQWVKEETPSADQDDLIMKNILFEDVSVNVQVRYLHTPPGYEHLMWVYLKEAVGVMLLYNLIDHSSFAELRRLVPLVKSMNVPAVMIVGCRCETPRDRWQVAPEEAATFASEIGALKSIEVSSRRNIQVDEAFNYLVEAIMRNKLYLYAQQNKIYYDVFGSQGCWVPNKAVLDQLLVARPPNRAPNSAPYPVSSSKSCLVQ